MKKVLITNTCLINNGDALLALGLYRRLKQDGYAVYIAGKKDVRLCRKKYPGLNWVGNPGTFSAPSERFLRIFPGLRKKAVLIKAAVHRVCRKYDAVISAGGGYINRFYGFEDVLYSLHLYKKFHRAGLVMNSQSVGPLTAEQKQMLHRYLPDFDLFMVRDNYSYEWVKGVSNVLLTNDAAFLNKLLRPQRCRMGRIGVSVRRWEEDGRQLKRYMSLIRALIMRCIDSGYFVEFISTCQGNPDYIDDSELAEKIMRTLPEAYRKKTKTDSREYVLSDLRKKVRRYDAVIGTRLHMCILAMISSVPAFNISYEKKGVECFRQLGLEAFSADYNEPADQALKKLNIFLEGLEKGYELQDLCFRKAVQMRKEADHYYQIMKEQVLD